MVEYRFAKPQEMPDVIDFIDLVFSHVGVPHDFEKLLPKVYGEGVDYSSQHAIAVEDGRVRGCIAVYPYELHMAGETLKVGYVGSVSVHRHARGGGVMRNLMQMHIDLAREQGLDMLLLGGQRQRYEYYGFVPCGGTWRYRVSASNVRHALKDTVSEDIRFKPLQEGSEADYAFGLYQRQPVTGARTRNNFIATASSYMARPWLITRNGAHVGYLIAGKDPSSLLEIVLEDEKLLTAVLKAWLENMGFRSISVCVPPYDVEMNRLLAQFAEGYDLSQNVMLLCLNPLKSISAWMKLKNAAAPLEDGKLCIQIDQGTPILIEVSAGEVNVTYSEQQPDLSLSHEEAMHLLFGHNRFYAPKTACKVPSGWFPLPLFIMDADTF